MKSTSGLSARIYPDIGVFRERESPARGDLPLDYRFREASLPEGILAASSTTKSYRVDGRDDYQIEFIVQSDGTIDMYARQHPSDPWGKSVVENHLYADHKICVSSGKEPRTLDRAKAIAMVWCNGWSEYCRTGTFPKGGRRVDV